MREHEFSLFPSSFFLFLSFTCFFLLRCVYVRRLYVQVSFSFLFYAHGHSRRGRKCVLDGLIFGVVMRVSMVQASVLLMNRPTVPPIDE